MNDLAAAPRPAGAGVSPVLARLRAATGPAHQALEDRLDAVARLTDPDQRPGLIARYAAFHIPGEAALGPRLTKLPDLDFAARRRTPALRPHAGPIAPAFPVPRSTAEALGMLYVLEGSTLGGRMILRALAEQGVDDPALAFLDPYGADTGARWRGFLAVLARATGDDEARIHAACRGGVAAFRHAERVLCGEAA